MDDSSDINCEIKTCKSITAPCSIMNRQKVQPELDKKTQVVPFYVVIHAIDGKSKEYVGTKGIVKKLRRKIYGSNISFTYYIDIIILIFLNAAFASAEIAVLSMNETRLKQMAEEGNKKAVRLANLTEQPARFLATIQVAITLAGFMQSAAAAEKFSAILVDKLMYVKMLDLELKWIMF